MHQTRLLGGVVGLRAIGEMGIAQTSADRHHSPVLHVLHPGQLAQALDNGIVVSSLTRIPADTTS